MGRFGFLLGLGLGVMVGFGAAWIGRSPAPRPPGHDGDPTTPVVSAKATPGAAETLSPAARAEQAAAELRRRVAEGLARGRVEELHEPLVTWSEHDPDAVLAYLLAVPRLPGRTNAFALPLGELTKRDPAAAARWMEAHLDDEERSNLIPLVLGRVSESHPEEALQLGLTPGLGAPPHSVGYALGAVAARDRAAALAIFAQLDPGQQELFATSMTDRWAELDLDSCIAWAEQTRNQPYAGSVGWEIVQQVAAKDPRAVLAVAERIGAPEEAIVTAFSNHPSPAVFTVLDRLSPSSRQALVSALGGELFPSHPDEMLAAIRRHAAPEEFATTAANAYTSWHQQDRRGAETWLAQQVDPTEQALLKRELVRRELTRDPTALLEQLALHGGSGTSMDESLLGEVLGEITATEPATAAQWLTRLPATLVGPMQIESVTGTWMEIDGAAASAWVAGLPPGEVRDQSLATVARSWAARQDTAQADQAVAAIRDPERQFAARYSVFSALHQSHPDAALEWLAQQPLNDEIKRAWRATLTR